jgi:hypothetical protein
MKQVKEDLFDVFLKPWQTIELIRAFMGKRDRVYKIHDMDIAKEIEISPMHLGSFKSRGTPTFALYVLKWCLKNNLDIREFIQK